MFRGGTIWIFTHGHFSTNGPHVGMAPPNRHIEPQNGAVSLFHLKPTSKGASRPENRPLEVCQLRLEPRKCESGAPLKGRASGGKDEGQSSCARGEVGAGQTLVYVGGCVFVRLCLCLLFVCLFVCVSFARSSFVVGSKGNQRDTHHFGRTTIRTRTNT